MGKVDKRDVKIPADVGKKDKCFFYKLFLYLFFMNFVQILIRIDFPSFKKCNIIMYCR